MTFPIEGWSSSAAVTLRQLPDRSIDVAVYGCTDAEKAEQQALAAMSLDEHGAAWAEVGARDAMIGKLQEKYRYMRPTLFHSPYEAAAAFVIGHRISIVQTRRIRAAISEQFGAATTVDGTDVYAFPSPEKLLTLTEIPGVSAVKVERLHGIARAALAGVLDRNYLRGLDDEVALKELRALPGIGEFFAQGILYRGAGKTDGLPSDDITLHAIRIAYGLAPDAPQSEVVAQTESWRPYRTWSNVLMHVWARETNTMPVRSYGRRS
jgi:DNA-3-methyladenine glycosylase II